MARSSNSTNSTSSSESNTDYEDFVSSYDPAKVVWPQGESLSKVVKFFDTINREHGLSLDMLATAWHMRSLLIPQYTEISRRTGKKFCTVLFQITEDDEHPWIYLTKKVGPHLQPSQTWTPVSLRTCVAMFEEGRDVFRSNVITDGDVCSKLRNATSQ